MNTILSFPFLSYYNFSVVECFATLNGNNSSGDIPQFSKSRFAILGKLHKLRNWIKLLFLPSVAKRLPELSNLAKSDEINLIVDRFNSLKEIVDKYPSKTFKMFIEKERGWCLRINLDCLKGHQD